MSVRNMLQERETGQLLHASRHHQNFSDTLEASYLSRVSGRLFKYKFGIHMNAAAAAAKSLQSCPTLCDSIDGSPPGSSVHGILQARILEWAAVSFSNAYKCATTNVQI